MRKPTLVLMLLFMGACFAASSASAAAKAKRVALVVGNSAYQNTSPLKNPRHDAADVAAALKGLGFHVVEGFDLPKAEFDRTLRNFAAALAYAKVGLFFYAGHGLQVSGENYLVPVDAKLTTAAALSFEMVRLGLVQSVMEQSTDTNIIFLDACRDNPLARNLARAMGTRGGTVGRGLAVTESGVGSLISFSTQPGNVAMDGVGRNSPFAGALVEEFSGSQEDLATVLIDVRNKVISETGGRQVPWEHSALRARFYLSGPPQSGTITGSSPLQLSEAAQTWATTKGTTSEAVLKAFIAKYRGTVFAELADVRLKELTHSPAQPPTKVSAAPKTGPFDGYWSLEAINGAGCYKKNNKWASAIIIEEGKIKTRAKKQGRIAENGKFEFYYPSFNDESFLGIFTGTLEGSSGKGTYRYGGRCRGTLTLRLQ